jgi:hypothetical protein
MIKRLPRPVESEESKFNRQFYDWLNDSHYWIEENDGKNVTCKWCGQEMPQILNQSMLCLKNPEILKIIEETKKEIYDNNPEVKNSYNYYKNKAHEFLIKWGCKSIGQAYTAHEIEIMLIEFVNELFNTPIENKSDNGDDDFKLFHTLSTLTKDELIEMLKDIYFKFKK